MIRVILPAHLRTLAGVIREVELEIEGTVSPEAIIDHLEEKYPSISGTIRDPTTRRRRPFVRYFACQEDLSHEPADAPLPRKVVEGIEPFIILGALAGG